MSLISWFISLFSKSPPALPPPSTPHTQHPDYIFGKELLTQAGFELRDTGYGKYTCHYCNLLVFYITRFEYRTNPKGETFKRVASNNEKCCFYCQYVNVLVKDHYQETPLIEYCRQYSLIEKPFTHPYRS